jgi:thioredoxin:protein disulfide reductase
MKSLPACLFALLFWLVTTPCRAAEEPLPPEQAYPVSARSVAPATVEVHIPITEAYYLYKDKFRFRAEPDSVQFGPPDLPPAKRKQDPYFGEVEVYRGDLRFTVPVNAPPGVRDFELTVVSQGCADMGVCYPPTPQTMHINLASSTPQASASGASGGLLAQALSRPPAAGTEAVEGSRPALPPEPAAAPSGGSADAPAASVGANTTQDESSRIASLLRLGSLPLVLASFFGFGLLMAFTPCTFPMIPILSGIIVGHGHHISRGRALALSLAYVLGMAVTYAVAGVVAGLSGTFLAAALQNVWVLGGFALVFVVLALSMFGFYELQLPSALQSRLSTTASHQPGGRFGGVITMGILSALIVGPCMAAPLAGALLYIAKTGNAALGGLALFVMALGMGVPLVIAGVAARHLLPKVGPWMEGVKKVFGVIMLAVALWLLNPVLPATTVMLGWAALAIFSGIYLHALDALPMQATGWQRFRKGCGVVALLWGAALLLGALAGSRDPLQPLAGLRVQAAATEAGPRFEQVNSVAELDARLSGAGRPVMLDFYADWCVSCKEMERYTFGDPAVQARLGQFLLLKADVTANSAEDKALLTRHGLFGPPGIIFFDAAGRERQALRVVGFEPAERFLPILEQALAATR